jgi:hypothetical protein
MGGFGMTLKHKTTIWALTSLIRLAWGAAGVAMRLGEAGVCLENWVDRTAACCGIDVLDVLAPLTKRHPGAEEA